MSMPQKQTFAQIPGLFLYRDYFNSDQASLLIRESLKLYDRLEEAVDPEVGLKKVHIPQLEASSCSTANI